MTWESLERGILRGCGQGHEGLLALRLFPCPGQRSMREQAPGRRCHRPSRTGHPQGGHRGNTHPLSLRRQIGSCLPRPRAPGSQRRRAHGCSRRGQTTAHGRANSRAQRSFTPLLEVVSKTPSERRYSDREGSRRPVATAHVQGPPRLCPRPAATQPPADSQEGPGLVSTCLCPPACQHCVHARHTSPQAGPGWETAESLKSQTRTRNPRLTQAFCAEAVRAPQHGAWRPLGTDAHPCSSWSLSHPLFFLRTVLQKSFMLAPVGNDCHVP